MKLNKHFFYLTVNFCRRRWITELIKEDGISFNLRNFQPHVVGIDQYFKQFLNDEPAVINFGFCNEPGESADVGNKEEAFVFHCKLKLLKKRTAFSLQLTA